MEQSNPETRDLIAPDFHLACGQRKKTIYAYLTADMDPAIWGAAPGIKAIEGQKIKKTGH